MMMSSAPLQSKTISPFSFSIMTLILFLSELNYNVYRSLNISVSLPFSITIILSSFFSMKTKPMYFAKLTNASSSGDEELYYPLYFYFITLWHKAKCKSELWIGEFYSPDYDISLFKSDKILSFSSASKSTFFIDFFSIADYIIFYSISRNELPPTESPSVNIEWSTVDSFNLPRIEGFP